MVEETDSLVFRAAGVEPITDDEIDRLLEYVGLEPKSRDRLRREIDSWRCWNWMFRGPYPQPTEIRNHAAQVEKATRRLLKLIDPNDNDGPWRFITGPESDWAMADIAPAWLATSP